LQWDGTETTLASFTGYDHAQRYGQTCAQAMARKEARRAWQGRSPLGIQAVIVDYDVYVVPLMAQACPGVRAVASNVPRRERLEMAHRLAFAFKAYSDTGERL
jgi:hypothetical protein